MYFMDMYCRMKTKRNIGFNVFAFVNNVLMNKNVHYVYVLCCVICICGVLYSISMHFIDRYVFYGYVLYINIYIYIIEWFFMESF